LPHAVAVSGESVPLLEESDETVADEVSSSGASVLRSLSVSPHTEGAVFG
jgi:hypothetical protein